MNVKDAAYFSLGSALIHAGDYRAFANLWIRSFKNPRSTSYSAIARRAGFKARSFPREVLLGKKTLSPASLEPFVHGLMMDGDVADAFRLLVARDVPECRKPNQSPASIQRHLDKLKARHADSGAWSPDALDLFKSPFTPMVFAALGTSTSGATLSELSARTGIDHVDLRQHLSLLHVHEMVTKNGPRYIAKSLHVSLIDPGDQSEGFKRFYIFALSRCQKLAETEMASDKRLFFGSCFSVKQSDLPQLKAELRRLLLSFVDAAENDAGDSVALLQAGLV